ncbi:MAG: SRPBCC domain-containing protein, partial [Betaproteobacteria bacterium]|nr:SRPBCC domain-containing protein [Betaproteobacteria bacterium]
MSASQTASAATPATELELVRLIDAPRRLVFAAWTDPVHVAKWFVLDGMSTKHVAIDVRPGGAWLIHLRMPDGTPVVVNRSFREIVPLQRIVFYEKCMVGERVALV